LFGTDEIRTTLPLGDDPAGLIHVSRDGTIIADHIHC
jgi:hypothetical protein